MDLEENRRSGSLKFAWDVLVAEEGENFVPTKNTNYDYHPWSIKIGCWNIWSRLTLKSKKQAKRSHLACQITSPINNKLGCFITSNQKDILIKQPSLWGSYLASPWLLFTKELHAYVQIISKTYIREPWCTGIP